MALTPLEEKLKEAHKKYLEVDERRRLSANRSDYEESFKATEEEVRVGVEAFLDHFGVAYSEESSTTELIASLREAIATHPPELTEDARTERLIREVDELDQTLRDISYFRQGYGATSERPQPADMRMKFAATVGSGPVNAFTTLLVHTRGTKPQKTEEKLKRESQLRLEGKLKDPKLDFAKLHKRIVRELEKDQGVQEYMAAIIRACRSQVRRKAWDQFASLPFEKDLAQCSGLIVNVLAKEPPPCELRGFLFLIANPYRDGEPVADVSFSATDSYEPSDDWAEGEMKYESLKSDSGSDVLASIYNLAEETGLRNLAEYPLELAYAAFMARETVRRYRKETGSGPVGVSSGFHDGDLIHLGLI